MLLDSNIVIYAASNQRAELVRLIEEPTMAVSIVTYIEVLGYHGLDESQERFCQNFFRNVVILPLTGQIADQAVELRQRRRMSLGDAIIAATGMAHNLALVTRNLRDFRWINELKLVDPFVS